VEEADDVVVGVGFEQEGSLEMAGYEVLLELGGVVH
jgi:hypothetical protein